MKNPPSFLQPFLWSYDLGLMDIERDKMILIKQVLEYGTKAATDWLQATYSESEIKAAITATPRSDWSKKSLALWQLVYSTEPRHAERQIA